MNRLNRHGKNKIVIIGGGGHAKVLVSVIQKLNDLRLLGYTDQKDRGLILGKKYLGTDKILTFLKKKYPYCQAVIGVGRIGIENSRNEIFNRLKKLNFELPAIISPRAVVNKNVFLGGGVEVFDGAIINSGTKIGSLAILNTGCIVEHDCQLGSNVLIAPGAVVCGGVEIGDNSFIGAGAVINQQIRIIKNCLIGSGAVVTKDCLTSGTYVGAPARLIKNSKKLT